MKVTRRAFLNHAVGAAALPVIAPAAWAESYPSRPVRVLVGFAAGGAADVSARIVGQWLSERFGRQFVIEDRTGAGGNIATEEVTKASADGYTLLNCASANAVNASLYGKLNFDFIHDIAPVAGTVQFPLVLIANPLVPAKTLGEFITYARGNPGKINFASAGTGTAEHLAGELFKMMAGVEMVHVPFRGGAPAITALLGGQVQAYFCATATAIAGLRAGMRPLAVTTTSPWEGLPNVPTVGESLPGYAVSLWFGIGAPRNTPSQIIDVLNRTINTGLADSNVKDRFVRLGGSPMAMTASAFGRFIAEETEKWAKVVHAARINAT